MNEFELEPSASGLEEHGTIEAADGGRFTATRVKRFWITYGATRRVCYLQAELGTLHPPHCVYFALIVAFGVESEAEAVKTAGDWLAERGLIVTPQTIMARACDCGQGNETWWTFCPCCGDEVRRYTILERNKQ